MLLLFYAPPPEKKSPVTEQEMDGARADLNTVANRKFPPEINSRSFILQQINILTELSRLILCGDVLLHYYTETITELFR
jgi:hypothetical protein